MKRLLSWLALPAIAAAILSSYVQTYYLGKREGREATGAYLQAAYDREAELRTVILLQRVQLQRSRLAECAEGVR